MSRRVLVSGASGLIGRGVVAALRARGAEVVALSRRASAAGEAERSAIQWDAMSGALDPAAVSGFDAVVHLAGEPVGAGRWTPERKRRIRESRVRGTQVLAEALARAEAPPRVFIGASGINFYGDRGETVLAEDAPRGAGFLAEASEQWERATAPLDGVARVAHLRIGPVLAQNGGMLATMLPVFRLGLGGPMGGGQAWVSWVTLRDVVGVVEHVLGSEAMAGAVNVVSPGVVRNADFVRALGEALHRPAVIPVPAWALRLLFGQMGEETVLSSVRGVPERLLADGFLFRDTEIRAALAWCLRT